MENSPGPPPNTPTDPSFRFIPRVPAVDEFLISFCAETVELNTYGHARRPSHVIEEEEGYVWPVSLGIEDEDAEEERQEPLRRCHLCDLEEPTSPDTDRLEQAWHDYEQLSEEWQCYVSQAPYGITIRNVAAARRWQRAYERQERLRREQERLEERRRSFQAAQAQVQRLRVDFVRTLRGMIRPGSASTPEGVALIRVLTMGAALNLHGAIGLINSAGLPRELINLIWDLQEGLRKVRQCQNELSAAQIPPEMRQMMSRVANVLRRRHGSRYSGLHGHRRHQGSSGPLDFGHPEHHNLLD